MIVRQAADVIFSRCFDMRDLTRLVLEGNAPKAARFMQMPGKPVVIVRPAFGGNKVEGAR